MGQGLTSHGMEDTQPLPVLTEHHTKATLFSFYAHCQSKLFKRRFDKYMNLYQMNKDYLISTLQTSISHWVTDKLAKKVTRGKSENI